MELSIFVGTYQQCLLLKMAYWCPLTGFCHCVFMCSGRGINPFLCTSQVFSLDLCLLKNFMFNFNVAKPISLSSKVSAFSCYALKVLLHCNINLPMIHLHIVLVRHSCIWPWNHCVLWVFFFFREKLNKNLASFP